MKATCPCNSFFHRFADIVRAGLVLDDEPVSGVALSDVSIVYTFGGFDTRVALPARYDGSHLVPKETWDLYKQDFLAARASGCAARCRAVLLKMLAQRQSEHSADLANNAHTDNVTDFFAANPSATLVATPLAIFLGASTHCRRLVEYIGQDLEQFFVTLNFARGDAGVIVCLNKNRTTSGWSRAKTWDARAQEWRTPHLHVEVRERAAATQRATLAKKREDKEEAKELGISVDELLLPPRHAFSEIGPRRGGQGRGPATRTDLGGSSAALERAARRRSLSLVPFRAARQRTGARSLSFRFGQRDSAPSALSLVPFRAARQCTVRCPLLLARRRRLFYLG